MKRLFRLFLLLVFIYALKPLWQESVEKYIPLTFLEPVDTKVEELFTTERLNRYELWLQSTKERTKRAIDAWKEPVEPSEPVILNEPKHSSFAIYNIELGDTKSEVERSLGEPRRKMTNEYGSSWFIYDENYHHFVLVSYDQNEQVRALYTNDDLISNDYELQLGSLKSDVRRTLGKPVQELKKGRTTYRLQENDGLDIYKLDDAYYFFFYDIHRNFQLNALLLVDKEWEEGKSGLYGNPSQAIREGYEATLFELTNAARVRNGKRAVEEFPALAQTARKHSADMAKRHYFSHDTPEGKSPFDRMKADHHRYVRAGENLAYGQFNSIFAHEGLLNSWDHRENLLMPQYTHLGVGVAFDEENTPYYTENFIQN